MSKVGENTHAEIRERLRGKLGKTAAVEIYRLHQETGLSENWIWGLTRDVRISRRSQKARRGKRKLQITDQHLTVVQNIWVKTRLPIRDAIRQAEINDLIPRGVLKPYYMRRWLYSKGLSRRLLDVDTGPIAYFEGRCPNDIHQSDTTDLEELHYNIASDRLEYAPQKNRPDKKGQKPPKIRVFVLLDDYSRAPFLKLLKGPMNQYTLIHCFNEGWEKKPNATRYPFHGLPRHAYTDNGGGYQGKILQAMFKAYGIHRIDTDPSSDKKDSLAKEHKARKRGKIEYIMKAINEKWLPKFLLASMTWTEAEKSLEEFAIEMGNHFHSRIQTTPFARWNEITKVKELPARELRDQFQYDFLERKVKKDGTFSIDHHVYRVPNYLKHPWCDAVEQKIAVYFHPGHYEKVRAVWRTYDEELFELKESLVSPAFHFAERDLTAKQIAFRAAESMDIKGWKVDEYPDKQPAFLPKTVDAFDSARISEKTVITSEGFLPSFAPERWLTLIPAMNFLRNEQVLFQEDSTSQQRQRDNAYVRAVMNGRERISETELTELVAKLKAEMQTGTEG
jgi:hypothetical protein